jgi:hypothetical protein
MDIFSDTAVCVLATVRNCWGVYGVIDIKEAAKRQVNLDGDGRMIELHVLPPGHADK